MKDKYKLLMKSYINWEPLVYEEKEKIDYHLVDFSMGQTRLYIYFHLIPLSHFS